MSAPTHAKATTPHTHQASTTPTYHGRRVAAADFFDLARIGRAQTAPPPFRNGDSVSCPLGNEWMRYHGRWIIPGQPHGLNLVDSMVTSWWQTRHTPGSLFALVHRLSPADMDLITGDHYTSSVFTGKEWVHKPVAGPSLRSFAHQSARTRTISVHLEWPSGIVTFHSGAGDVFFHPAAPAHIPAPGA